jgi:Fe(3+) dicitrate transport protein
MEVESVTIIGAKEDVKDLAGSGAVISNEDLEKAMDTDIAKILSAIPGMYMRTEEGYGLRPNISIRGTAIERSGKVTIMEDGVLVCTITVYIFSRVLFSYNWENSFC